jgi:hypothetical protein
MTGLTKYVRSELRKILATPHTADELLQVLSHVVLKCGFATHLVDLVVAQLRLQRAQVALKLGTISAWMAPTDPRFLDIVGKVMGDFVLPHPEEPEGDVFDELQRELFGLYSQLEAVAALSSTTSSSSQSSSSNANSISTATHSNKPGSGFANWWEPDFALVLEGTTFKCHKWIICGRWSFMRDAMAFGGTEAETSMMELPSEAFPTPALLQCFIRYLYTNEVDQFDNDDDCISILRLAKEFRLINSNNGKDVLGFGILLDKCRSALLKQLTVDNCIALYKRILELGSEDQQISVRTFIVHHVLELADNPKTQNELESLGPKELVRILTSMARLR